MKTVETFIYVGGSLGLVGGHHRDPRLSFVRLSDYLELDAKLRRLATDSLHDLNQIGGLQEDNATLKAEVEGLEHQVRYWRIEAECDHGRWLRCLEDLEKLRSKPSV